MAGALIVTAELGAEDFGWLNDLRRHHYPPERNQLPAHLTMFHVLPPSAEQEVRQLLAGLVARAAPRAFIAGVMDLGGGAAFRIASDELDDIRAEIADRLTGLLTAQDRAGWSAHVTIQNKVPPREAKTLIHALGSQFDMRPIRIAGLGLHRYLGGPWETLRSYSFRG
ncbi:MAG TPA: 2'-5' RNA ligase family protein [Sphingomicrobium sp.]|nr:2'-5' RNA ligase family protein [Sphingomicrobium sp.]